MNISHTNLRENEKIGKYQLIRFLGDGTFGAVFETYHSGLDLRCAIKVGVREFADAKGLDWNLVRQSLLDEPKIMANLDEHPNIIRVYDAGEYADYPYVVMELMESGLDKFIGKLNRAQAIAVFKQIGSAVKHLHDHSYVHQDIKPPNILIKQGENGRIVAKIADLGTAKYIRATGSRVGYKGLVWTTGYVEPQVATGKAETGLESDIYSLGATFYHALTGQMPDPSQTQMPNELDPDIPKSLSDLIMDMMIC